MTGGLSFVFGLLSLATFPVAVAVARWRGYDVIDAAPAIPTALVLGAIAIWLARRARRRLDRAVAHVGRSRFVRLGRVLGVAGFLLSVTAALAVGVSMALEAVAD